MKMIRTLPIQLHISDEDDLNLHNIKFITREYGFFTKPKYTFWTSTNKRKKNSRYMSDWHRFLSQDAPQLMSGKTPYFYLLEVSQRARILDIDGYDDTVEFTEKYTDLKTKDLYNLYIRIDVKTNWNLVAESYDAVHYSGRGGRRQIGGVFFKWDVESTVWFRNKFVSIRRM